MFVRHPLDSADEQRGRGLILLEEGCRKLCSRARGKLVFIVLAREQSQTERRISQDFHSEFVTTLLESILISERVEERVLYLRV